MTNEKCFKGTNVKIEHADEADQCQVEIVEKMIKGGMRFPEGTVSCSLGYAEIVAQLADGTQRILDCLELPFSTENRSDAYIAKVVQSGIDGKWDTF